MTVSSIVPFPVEFTATTAPCTHYVTPCKKKRHGRTPGHHQTNAPAVTDPRRFKTPYNPKERIWQEAERLRTAHLAVDKSVSKWADDLFQFVLAFRGDGGQI